MEAFVELLKLIIPAAAILYGMYLVMQGFLNRDLKARQLDIRGKSIETVLPLRLQAYERICLLLERLSPQSLLLRVNHGGLSAKDYQRVLLDEIRNEFNHNVSQQVYMSEAIWTLVKNSKEDLVVLINESIVALSTEATGLDLAKKIFERTMEKQVDPMGHALSELKKEIQQIF
ncbi:MAG: hypothetical protein ACO263_07130 [Cyclobacteriaceae bacterium]